MGEQGFDEGAGQQVEEPKTRDTRELDRVLDAVGWGLFFIWVGIAFLANVPLGVGLLGVGVITLAMQAVRRYFRLKVQGFWIAVGAVFVLSGFWDLLQEKLSLVPIVLIVIGLAIVVSAVRGKGGRGE